MATRLGEIDPPSAAELLTEATFIDVRTPQEFRYDIGRIAGSVNIPLQELVVGGLPDELAEQACLVMVCRSGARSGQAASIIAAQAEGEVLNLTGGMIAWTLHQLPVDQGDPADD